MKFDLNYFIALSKKQGIDFERHGNSINYIVDDETPESSEQLIAEVGSQNFNDLLEFLPDLDQDCFQYDLFKNL